MIGGYHSIVQLGMVIKIFRNQKSSSIICGCDWVIRFKFLDHKKCTLSDSIESVHVREIYTNTCDPIFRDQYVVVRTKAGEYKKMY